MTFAPYVVPNRRFNDISVDFLISSPTAEQWYSGPDQVLPERKWCADRIKPGSTILDCGAHHGMTSILFAKLTGAAGKVIAFEPVQANAEIIRKNASLNHLANIDVRACGVSDKRETIYVTLGENPVLSEVDALPFYRKFNNPWSNKAKLDIRTIDEQIPSSVSVDLIKLDVEGAELSALRGAARVLQSRPLMAIEIHNFIHGGKDLPAIRDILAPLKYRYYINGDILDPVTGPFDALDIDFVAKFENPHIYCEPLPQ